MCLPAGRPATVAPTLANMSDGEEDKTRLTALSARESVTDRILPPLVDMNDSDEHAACLAALLADENAQLNQPLNFEMIPHIDRRVRKFVLHRRVSTTRLMQQGGNLRPELLPRAQLPQLLDQALHMTMTIF